MTKEKPYIIIFIYLLALLSPNLVLTFLTQNSDYSTLSTIINLLGATLILFVHFKIKEPAKQNISKKNYFATIILWGILGALFVVAIQYLGLHIEKLLLPSVSPSTNTQNILFLTKRNPFYFLSIILALPVMEEFAFRKALTEILPLSFPHILKGILSSLLFAVAHNDGHYLVYFSIGLLFYFLYLKTESIFTPIISHALMNSFVLISQLL